MEINTLHTRNFMGLPGDRKYELGKINALIAPNGSGKTSVISALRYALTGMETDEMIHSGAASCAVQIDIPSGTLRRDKKKGKANSYRVDGKSASLGELNRRIESETGGSIKTGKIITSSELLSELDSRQFGDLLLQYLPEMMSKDTVISKVSGATSSMVKIMKENLPDGDFGPAALDGFFAYLTETRRRVKKEIIELETAVRLYGGIPETSETRKQLEQKLSTLTKKRDEAVLFENQLQHYMQVKAQIERNQASIAHMDKEIASITAIQHPDGERAAVEDLMMASRKAAQAALEAMKQDRAYYNTLKQAVDSIRQPICPLSKNLKCTTDKSGILEELKGAVKAACESYNRHHAEMEEAKTKALSTEEKLKAIDADNAAAARRESLKTQRAQLAENFLKLPAKPQKGPDLAEINNELEKVQKSLRNMESQQKALEAEGQIKQKKLELADLEALYAAFSPKGEVKENITKFYLDEFSGPLNEKCRKMFPGMDIKFVSEDGVKISVDPKGLGKYIPMSALSGGEKACVVFLLMLLFGNLSGFRTIIIDELSVLDKGVLEGLISVMEENQDEFDLAMIASVNHVESIEIIRKHKVKELSI